MGSRRTFAGWLGRWPWFADSRADHAPNQGVNYACLAAAATPRVAYSSLKPSPSHTAGGITMGYAKYIGRVGALAVALGVGAAVATGQGMGMARADDSPPADPPSAPSDPSPGAPPAGPSGDLNSPTPPSDTPTPPSTSGEPPSAPANTPSVPDMK